MIKNIQRKNVDIHVFFMELLSKWFQNKSPPQDAPEFLINFLYFFGAFTVEQLEKT